MWLTLLWENKRIIGEIIGIVLLIFISWWFFIHNPKIISDLKEDNAELLRLVKNGETSINLINDIQKGRVTSYAHVQMQLSSIRKNAIPRRTILISNGGVLSTMPTTNSSH
jgi:hypothetical protein